jgi:hypothetical protein
MQIHSCGLSQSHVVVRLRQNMVEGQRHSRDRESLGNLLLEMKCNAVLTNVSAPIILKDMRLPHALMSSLPTTKKHKCKPRPSSRPWFRRENLVGKKRL